MGNMDERQFRISYWFVMNKELLKNIVSAFFIIVNLLLVAYLLYGLINNYIIRYSDNRAMIFSLVNDPLQIQEITNKLLPKSLEISTIQILPATDGADVFAQVKNPNEKWGATFDYYFILPNGQTSRRSSFIFPGQSRIIFDLSVENGNQATQLILADINWERHNNFQADLTQKINFEFNDITYVPSSELSADGSSQISRITFNIKNSSAYNFAEPSFLVLLYRGDSISGINYITTTELFSGQTKNLAVTWFERIAENARIEIVPDINIMDPKAFLGFEGETKFE